mmetsp:Transcript_29096/g.54426  ORF Transcript_29096/g.54426 Transcript_29096/m.54426 type:complete len:164 (-) Transcript_29096:1197-1688(-)
MQSVPDGTTSVSGWFALDPRTRIFEPCPKVTCEPWRRIGERKRNSCVEKPQKLMEIIDYIDVNRTEKNETIVYSSSMSPLLGNDPSEEEVRWSEEEVRWAKGIDKETFELLDAEGVSRWLRIGRKAHNFDGTMVRTLIESEYEGIDLLRVQADVFTSVTAISF